MYDEKPKKKKREASSSIRTIAIYIAVLVITALVTMFVLTVLEPAVGNVFSNIIAADNF